MIDVRYINKNFGDICAVKNISLRIESNQVFGLLGTNGAGKSTLLRIICDILYPDSGTVMIDGRVIHDNPEVKKNIFFIPDDAYFFPGATPETMMSYYSGYYENFDKNRCKYLINSFNLGITRTIDTYSKGMKRLLSIILGISAGTPYLICDETFDGLDPVVRQGVKSLLARDMDKRGLTSVISSHNLREMEDICDHIGLLHKGGVILSEDVSTISDKIQKVQAVFMDDAKRIETENKLDIKSVNNVGHIYTYIINATRDDAERIFSEASAIYYEILDLTMEEVFISETEAAGYDIRNFIKE